MWWGSDARSAGQAHVTTISSPFCSATSHVPLSRVSLPPPPWKPPPKIQKSTGTGLTGLTAGA